MIKVSTNNTIENSDWSRLLIPNPEEFWYGKAEGFLDRCSDALSQRWAWDIPRVQGDLSIIIYSWVRIIQFSSNICPLRLIGTQIPSQSKVPERPRGIRPSPKRPKEISPGPQPGTAVPCRAWRLHQCTRKPGTALHGHRNVHRRTVYCVLRCTINVHENPVQRSMVIGMYIAEQCTVFCGVPSMS